MGEIEKESYPLFARQEDRDKLNEMYKFTFEKLLPLIDDVGDMKNTVYGPNRDKGLLGDSYDSKNKIDTLIKDVNEIKDSKKNIVTWGIAIFSVLVSIGAWFKKLGG